MGVRRKYFAWIKNTGTARAKANEIVVIDWPKDKIFLSIPWVSKIPQIKVIIILAILRNATLLPKRSNNGPKRKPNWV